MRYLKTKKAWFFFKAASKDIIVLIEVWIMVMKDWVLVTGGVGYVGSHCVVKILEAGHNVAVMDNLSNADIGQSTYLLALYKFFPRIIS